MKLSDRSKKVHISIAVLIGVMFFALSFTIYLSQIKSIEANEKLNIAQTYLVIQDTVEFTMLDNISLIRGLAAYIEMNSTYDDEEMQKLLSILYDDRLEEVRNVGIIDDTVLRWVYPLEGNEAVIGVDLAKVEGQSEGIIAVKTSLKSLMFGPVDLVQGGKGFIIRIPIMKEDQFWGMASVVLNADYFFGLLEDFEMNQHVNLLLTHAGNEDDIIYGDHEVLFENPVSFNANESDVFFWDVYIVPEDGWHDSSRYTLWIVLILSVISLYIMRRVYVAFSDFAHMSEDRDSKTKLSETDPFTGISNRGHLNQCMLDEILRSDRSEQSLSMIYFDLDHFKGINDTYGHAQGDAVLLSVVSAVASVIRANDLFARWGGDEFVILLPYTDLKGAESVAEKIRECISGLTFEQGFKISASIGVAERVQLEFMESWFKRVDQALYSSKRMGRDRVTLSDHFEDKILRKIIWLDKWNSGIEEIDKAHYHASELCNNLVISSFDDENYDETIRLAGELLKDIQDHFAFEIAYLESVNYPEVKQHEAIHQRLYTSTEDLYEKLLNRIISTEELLTYLRDVVVVGHLVNVDQNYRAYL